MLMQIEDSEWFYISFASERFLGGVIVRAEELGSAVNEATRLGINPGGQAIGGRIPVTHVPTEAYRERLLAKDECNAIWDDCMSLGDVRGEFDEDQIPRVDQPVPLASKDGDA